MSLADWLYVFGGTGASLHTRFVRNERPMMKFRDVLRCVQVTGAARWVKASHSTSTDPGRGRREPSLWTRRTSGASQRTSLTSDTLIQSSHKSQLQPRSFQLPTLPHLTRTSLRTSRTAQIAVRSAPCLSSMLQFKAKIGSAVARKGCATPTSRNEGVIVDSSTDNGVTWTVLQVRAWRGVETRGQTEFQFYRENTLIPGPTTTHSHPHYLCTGSPVETSFPPDPHSHLPRTSHVTRLPCVHSCLLSTSTRCVAEPSGHVKRHCCESSQSVLQVLDPDLLKGDPETISITLPQRAKHPSAIFRWWQPLHRLGEHVISVQGCCRWTTIGMEKRHAVGITGNFSVWQSGR